MIQWRRVLQATADATFWFVAVCFATLARFDFNFAVINWGQVILIALLAAGLQVVAGTLLSLYRGRYFYGSFDEVAGVVLSVMLVWGGLLLGIAVQPGRSVPIGAILGAGALALLLTLGLRFVVRAVRTYALNKRPGGEPIVMYGAGEAAEQLLRGMTRDKNNPYRAVALLDDNPSKRRLRMHGVPVAGTRNDIVRVAKTTGATTVLVSFASADSATIREVVEICGAAGLELKVVPPVSELVGGKVGVQDIRDVDEADLLGRAQVDTDIDSIAHLLHGKRVLVTGAGGSIGSELARQIHRLGPAALGLLDRDESALQSVEILISGRGLLTDENLLLADIRDVDRVNEVFSRFEPEVVFHAAALKHLPLLERNPVEAVKTNVEGTLNVLRAARDAGVKTFVNISTDKAADPINVLGYSKKITERLTASFAESTGDAYLSVRFGNVLGSRGSVLPSFQEQILAGGPVTVTHRQVTRYFMTIPEAVQLVLQASALGDGGEVMILDMGQPVRIADVAQDLITLSGKKVEIVYTGLRPGEKLHEDLFDVVAERKPTKHELVSCAVVDALDPIALSGLDRQTSDQTVRNSLERLAVGSAASVTDPEAMTEAQP
ncbi:MAG: nucleoside-diphosphate sugar epimerase/dehydratase [Candidatus Nanopelagicales bacterium]